MKLIGNIRLQALACLVFFGLLAPGTLQAQCPSVMGTGDPAVILLNLYGVPHGNYFVSEPSGVNISVTGGVQLGAIFSPGFQLVAGAEFSGTERTLTPEDPLNSVGWYYKSFLLELPLEMRMRIYHSKKDEAFFTLGAGFMFANVKQTNDPTVTRDELNFEQLFGRIGFEHTITVKKTFNILWGLIGKVDPIALIDENHSGINGTYYGGLKVGIQFGL